MTGRVIQFRPRRRPLLETLIGLVRERVPEPEISAIIAQGYPDLDRNEYMAALADAIAYVFPQFNAHGGGAA